MHSKTNNIEFMIYDNTNEVIKELFELVLNRYQTGLETSIRGSDCFFDFVHLMYYKCHKIGFRGSGSFIDSPYWIRNKKVTINSINHINKKIVSASICYNTQVKS